jgi:hypothetical protein
MRPLQWQSQQPIRGQRPKTQDPGGAAGFAPKWATATSGQRHAACRIYRSRSGSLQPAAACGSGQGSGPGLPGLPAASCQVLASNSVVQPAASCQCYQQQPAAASCQLPAGRPAGRPATCDLRPAEPTAAAVPAARSSSQQPTAGKEAKRGGQREKMPKKARLLQRQRERKAESKGGGHKQRAEQWREHTGARGAPAPAPAPRREGT